MSTEFVALDRSLAERITGLFDQSKKNILEIAAIAAEIRAAHFDESVRAYSPSFEKFWQDFDLKSSFGSRPNFTKYAYAHEAVERAKSFGSTEEALPGSLKALYAISQLDDNELQLCLEDTWFRSAVTDDRSVWNRISSEPKPLIQPDATERQINSWRKKWRDPSARSEKKHEITVAEFRIDSSLLKTKGSAAVQKARDLISEIRNLMTRFDDDMIGLKINDNAISKLDSSVTGTKEARRFAHELDTSCDRAMSETAEAA